MIDLNDIPIMTQEQFNTLSPEEKYDLVEELVNRIMDEAPIKMQKYFIKTLECSDFFGEEYEHELFANKTLSVQLKVTDDYYQRMQYLKSILEIRTEYDDLLESYDNEEDEENL